MKLIYILLGVTLFVTACQEEPEPGGTKVQDFAGEWHVKFSQETSPGVYEDLLGGYFKLMTYNTSGNSDSLWIDDLETLSAYGIGLKFKAVANRKDFTFSVPASKSIYPYFDEDDEDEEFPLYHDIAVTDGKVLKGLGLSISKVKTDSIFMQVEYDGDGDVYVISGHRRTGFLEDEIE